MNNIARSQVSPDPTHNNKATATILLEQQQQLGQTIGAKTNIVNMTTQRQGQRDLNMKLELRRKLLKVPEQSRASHTQTQYYQALWRDVKHLHPLLRESVCVLSWPRRAPTPH
jgi:hypothetical protein